MVNKYDESIKLTYNYTYRMLVHLKNIIENFKTLEKLLFKISDEVVN